MDYSGNVDYDVNTPFKYEGDDQDHMPPSEGSGGVDDPNKHMNDALTAVEKVLLTLRFFATGNFLITCGDFSGIHKSTACKTVATVAKAIAELRPQYIRMPDGEEALSVKNKFYDIGKFPRVVGVIDCTHVRIQSPGGDEPEVYRNRKMYFSINVQVVGGPDLQIYDIVTRWGGSTHDQTIFNASRICHRFENGEFDGGFLLGDSGYECRAYMMVPVNARTHAEGLYNESLIRTRNTVERLFGVLKRRFPILASGIRITKDTIQKAEYYIVACAVLHNIACRNREAEPPVDPNLPLQVPPEVNVEIQPSQNERNPRYRVRSGLVG
ncbi:hypothetical protein M8J76_006807 [Diaphorina citri]|nr:hypothetical protein M8J76_006807 [Diaphorina citri]